MEYRIRHVSGEYRWHLARIAPTVNDGGEITRWVAATFDIHDRRVAEDALRASERRFDTFFSLSPQPMAITRQSDGAFVSANSAFNALTGFANDELVGKTSVELGMICAEDHTGAAEFFSGGSGRSREFSVRRKDGALLTVLVWSADIEIDGVPCFVNTSTDLTQRRAMEDALRQSEAEARARADELAALMDAVPAIVLIARDADCATVTGNRMAYEMLGIPVGGNLSRDRENQTLTRHFGVFANGEQLPPERLALARAARGEDLRSIDEEIRFGDGRIVQVYGGAMPLRDSSGAPRGAIAALLDVTRLKQAEDALRRTDRRKDEFLALLSHELRNPLTPILTSARLLERHADAESRHDLGVIVRQVKHLGRLVDDLLDVSRVARGAVTLARTRVETAAIVARALAATAPLCEERGHFVDVTVPERGLVIEGDEVRLTQIVDNLLSNAACYTPPGGTIRVSAQCDDGFVVLSVQDSGIGIEPSLLPDLFEIFVQGPRGSDRADGGLGIGLSLVKGLTELHGGTVTAHSGGVGRGSTFTVRLPAAASANRSPRTSGPTRVTDVPGSARARVLIVDDHRDVVDGLSRLLKALGYDVRAALHPLDAIAIAESFRPQLAILDIGLPVMDGYALSATLRARLGEDSPVLIALSGYSQPHDRQRSEAAGFVLHLAKPVDVDQLVDALTRLVPDASG
jgi:PAS domain S-box-containing protein